jgi:methionine synthase II (cobalamin-independent)
MNQLVPIKAIPQESRQKQYLLLIDWLIKTLSLTGEKAADRIEVLIPMIEECAWSLTLEDIKKAFTFYVQGKLPIEPRDNYLTVILFSKVIEAYKQQRVVKKELPQLPEKSQKEKDNIILSGVINCFNQFTKTNSIINGYTWVYDHLDENNIINFSDDEKRKQMPIAKKKLIIENKSNLNRGDYKVFMSDMENKRKNQAVINKAKKMLLERFFLGLQAEGKHVKEVI